MTPLRDDPEFRALSQKVTDLHTRFGNLESSIGDVAKAFSSAKGAFEVLEWLGKVAKVLLPIIITFAVIGFTASEWWDGVKKMRGH